MGTFPFRCKSGSAVAVDTALLAAQPVAGAGFDFAEDDLRAPPAGDLNENQVVNQDRRHARSSTVLSMEKLQRAGWCLIVLSFPAVPFLMAQWWEPIGWALIAFLGIAMFFALFDRR